MSNNLSFNTAPHFQLKKLFIFIFRFFYNARKSCAPFIEILFPHGKFLHGKILTRNPNPLNFPPQPEKSPQKRRYSSQ